MSVFSSYTEIKPYTIHLVFLTINDIVVSCVTIQSLISKQIGYFLTTSFCQSYGMILLTSFVPGISYHILMSIDRCRAVLYPVSYRAFLAKPRKAKCQVIARILICISFWLISTTIGSKLDIYKMVYEPSYGGCYMESGSTSLSTTIATIILYCVLPISVELSCHILIWLKIKKLQKSGRRNVMRTYLTLALTLVTFYICWIPLIVIHLVAYFERHYIVFLAPILVAMCFQSALSLFIYTYSNAEFKKALLKLFTIKAKILH